MIEYIKYIKKYIKYIKNVLYQSIYTPGQKFEKNIDFLPSEEINKLFQIENIITCFYCIAYYNI